MEPQPRVTNTDEAKATYAEISAAAEVLRTFRPFFLCTTKLHKLSGWSHNRLILFKKKVVGLAFFAVKRTKTTPVAPILLTGPLQEKITVITGKLGNSQDVMLRNLEPKLAIVYIDSIVDFHTINDNIMLRRKLLY